MSAFIAGGATVEAGNGRAPRPTESPCFERPVAGELSVGGRKLAGSAQWRDGGALLQHGSILVDDDQTSVAELLIGEALMGLANLVCDLGATRLGICSEARCDHVFVDTSPNQSRRYCSDRCSSRANVAAFRARQKAASAS